MASRNVPSAQTRQQRAAAWNRTAVWCLVVLLALWAAQRLAYLGAYVDLPFLFGPVCDSQVYRTAALAVRRGDLGHPALVAFSPLYAYFLAALDPLEPLRWVSVQFALGLGTGAVVFAVAHRLAGIRAACAAGALYALSGTLLFYESKMLSETLSLALVAAWLAVASHKRAMADARWNAAAGALFGLAVLARASLVFAAPFVVALSWLFPGPQGRWRRTAAAAAGLVAVLLCNGAWNWVHAGRFVPVIMVSRTIAHTTSETWTGKITDASGSAEPAAWDVVAQAAAALKSPRDAAPSPWAAIDWKGLVKGAPAKVYGWASLREKLFQYGYVGERTELAVLRPMVVSFPLLLLLGGLGGWVVARRRGWRAVLPFVPVVLGTVAVSVVYHPSARYRLAAWVPLLPLAAVGGVAVWERIRAWRTRPRAAAGALAVLLGAVALMVAVAAQRLHHPGWWEHHKAVSALAAGRIEEAAAYLRRAERREPGDPRLAAAVARTRRELEGGGRAP